MAQEALEEIVVTARFREENLQQTPLAITAITGDMLEARGATSTLDLDAFVPNAVIAPLGAGWGSTAAAFIRGIGLGDNSLSFEPGVPIYIDDVYHGRPQGAVLDLLDVERVEVLRGPQGTLFGKNTLGGAVRIISRKPEGDGTGFLDRRRRLARPLERARLVRLRARRGQGVRARLGVVEDARRLLRHPRLRMRERRGLARASAAPASRPARSAPRRRDADSTTRVDLARRDTHPAIGGVALGSVLGPTDDRGCVVDQLGSENVQSGRVAVRFLASDTVEVNVDHRPHVHRPAGPGRQVHGATAHDRTACRPASRAASTTGTTTSRCPVFGAGGQFDGRFQTNDEYTSYHRFGFDPLTRPHHAERQRAHALGPADDGRLGHHRQRCSFKSTTSYREFDNSFGRDSDGTPLPQLFTWDTSKHEQFTQEFQFSGLAGPNDGVDWTTGFFYYDAFDSNQGYVNTFTLHVELLRPQGRAGPQRTTPCSRTSTGTSPTSSACRAACATPTTRRTRHLSRDGQHGAARASALPQFVLIPQHRWSSSKSEEWSPKISFDYQFTDTIMGYVALSTGFRGGGFGPRPANSAAGRGVRARVHRQLRDRREDRLARRAAALQRRHLLHGEHRQAAADADLRAVRADARRTGSAP